MRGLILQLIYLLGAFICAPLLPLLAWQARRVRREVRALPEAMLHRDATAPGPVPPLRLVLLGESTIAGVGVTDQRDGIAGQLARALADSLGCAVRWQVFARNGCTARDCRREFVPLLLAEPIDLIVVGLGGNEAFTLNSPRAFRRQMGELIRSIRERHPAVPIVIPSLPPVGEFPAFPWLMRVVLGGLIRLHGLALLDLPAAEPGVHYLPGPIRLRDWLGRVPGVTDAQGFFSDGVHPNALTYGVLSREIAGAVIDRGLIPSRAGPDPR